jgi:hypothetical protein
MPGIDQVINDRMNAFAGQPEALAQRYAQNQDLLDLLALQKMKTDKAAAMREVQASMQANPATVRDQLSQEAMTQTRQEMAAQAMQGAQGMQLNQRRAMQARGIPTLPAPNMARRQGYQQGGIIPAEPTMGAVPPSAVGNEQIKQFADEYMSIKRALEDPQQAEFKERNQMLLQDLIRQMGDQMPAVMQYIDSMKGIVEPRGFREGGGIFGPTGIFGPSARAASSFTQFLVSKGIETLADVSEAVGRQLVQEFLAQKSAGDRRTELAEMAGAPGSEGARQAQPEVTERPYIPTGRASVADSQMENLTGAVRGGLEMLVPDRFAPVEWMAKIGRNMPGTDLGQSPRLRLPTIGLPNIVEGMAKIGRNMPGTDLGQSPRLRLPTQTPTRGVSTGRRARREQTPPETAPRMSNEDLAELVGMDPNAGLGALLLGEPGGPGVPPSRRRMALEAIKQAITSPFTGQPTPETPATTPAPAPITEPAGLSALVDRITEVREPFRMQGTEPSGMRTPQDYLASLARQQARQRAEQPETAEQPVSRYQEELDRLRAQEEDPMRALATFLTGMGSGRGRGLGQSLAAGAQALNAAEREIDARRLQLVEALQNEEITAAEAARENRRLDLMGEDIEVQREYNQQRVNLEERVERLRAQGRLQEAKAALNQGAMELFTGPLEQQAIREEVENSAVARGLSETEINELLQRRTQEKIQDYIRSTAESSGLNALATATAQTFMPEDEFAEEMTITE